ncbi:hypothetical protein [Burkholderia sp. MSMB1589WGS]|uniref:hypothetical protein n=1 Tax=Burkholderia sp. MSMB1589WGS TaxID=1636425 RepID=UPI000B32006E|nr:hypothetical protein [Burkholderia sp. MSMB1589WGS]
MNDQQQSRADALTDHSRMLSQCAHEILLKLDIIDQREGGASAETERIQEDVEILQGIAHDLDLIAASPIEQPAPLTAQAEQHADWRGDFERQTSAAGFDLSREEWGGEYCHPDSADAFRWYYTGRLDEACSGATSSQPVAALPQPVLDALRFYANGHHFYIDRDHQDFDTVSGEPVNWLYSERDDDITMIEDGSIAKAALCGGVLGSEEPEKPLEGEVFSVQVATSANETGAEGATSDSWARRFEQCMHSLVPALNYIQAHPGQFDARPGDDLLPIIGAWFPKLAALVSSPATAAAAPADERAAFEAFCEHYVDAADEIDREWLFRMLRNWSAWQARAAASPAAKAVAQWQYRIVADLPAGQWHNCSEETAKRLQAPEYAADHEIRALYAAPQPAQADAPDEEAYVAKRMAETLATVYTTIIGDDEVDADDGLNAIERVVRAAQVLRLEVNLYRAQAYAPAEARV